MEQFGGVKVESGGGCAVIEENPQTPAPFAIGACISRIS